jgi:hypothetical protein
MARGTFAVALGLTAATFVGLRASAEIPVGSPAGVAATECDEVARRVRAYRESYRTGYRNGIFSPLMTAERRLRAAERAAERLRCSAPTFIADRPEPSRVSGGPPERFYAGPKRTGK